jgi:hypothetical protein
MPAKMVAHIRTALEVAKALTEIHRLNIFHVDLNPMNILHRVENSSLWARYSTRCWRVIPERGELKYPPVSTVIRISIRTSRRFCSRHLARIPPRAIPQSRSFTQFSPLILKKYGRDDRGRWQPNSRHHFDFSRVSGLFPHTSDTNVVSWVSAEVDQAGNVSASGGHDEQAAVT